MVNHYNVNVEYDTVGVSLKLYLKFRTVLIEHCSAGVERYRTLFSLALLGLVQ